MKRNLFDYLPGVLIVIFLILLYIVFHIYIPHKYNNELKAKNTSVCCQAFTKDNVPCCIKGFIRFVPDSLTIVDETEYGKFISKIILQQECIKYHSDSINIDMINSMVDDINTAFQKECPELTYYWISFFTYNECEIIKTSS